MAIAKVIEIVASSGHSFEDAIQEGLLQVSSTVRGIHGIEVKSWTAKVEDNRISRYNVTLHIAFSVDRPEQD